MPRSIDEDQPKLADKSGPKCQQWITQIATRAMDEDNRWCIGIMGGQVNIVQAHPVDFGKFADGRKSGFNLRLLKCRENEPTNRDQNHDENKAQSNSLQHLQ